MPLQQNSSYEFLHNSLILHYVLVILYYTVASELLFVFYYTEMHLAIDYLVLLYNSPKAHIRSFLCMLVMFACVRMQTGIHSLFVQNCFRLLIILVPYLFGGTQAISV